MNYKMIGYILGWILVFVAIFMAVPIITAIIYWEEAVWSFLGTAVICLGAGLLITKFRPQNNALHSRDGYLIVSLSWIILSIFGALPMFLCGSIPSFVDALFESASGFTTTGATILAEVENLPRSVLMWRSFSHWVGGMGVLVFIMAFLPLSGGQNLHIMKAESTGPAVSKLVPRVKTTALILYFLYFVLTVAEFIMLICGGMSVFEALNTAFATAGTGGFGVRNNSFADFSPYIQIVVTVFMLLFSINFGSIFFLLKGRIKEGFNLEVRVFLAIVASAIVLIALNILPLYGNLEDCFRHSAFTVASIISTTGFSTEDFNLWPELSRSLIVLLMFVGACAGSTGGGIKVSRIIILIKGMVKELELIIHPKQVKKIRMDGHQIEHETVRSVNMYMVCYVLIFVLSMIILSFDNLDLITNFTAVSAMVNNIGPGLELVGPTSNFSLFSDPVKIVLIFDMLAGRLELFPMLILFSPVTWKK